MTGRNDPTAGAGSDAAATRDVDAAPREADPRRAAVDDGIDVARLALETSLKRNAPDPRPPTKSEVPPEAFERVDPARIAEEPFRHDVLALLRLLERSRPDRPRIGRNRTIADEIVRIGQDPYMAFPASNVARFGTDQRGRAEVIVRFLGLLGPQGALPLSTTEEALTWFLQRDDAFARFLDLFNNRFLQLFFRAFAEARPIAHRDRPAEDRFGDWLGSLAGFGLPAFRGRDSVGDLVKLQYAGLVAPKVKSAARLKALIAGVLGVKVEIDQLVGQWLTLEPEERMALGRNAMAIGADTIVGARVYSVDNKIRIRILTPSLAVYEEFLPGGRSSRMLADLVFFYVGLEFDYDVELGLPAREAPAASLGRSGRLGWTGWIAPDRAAREDRILTDARFHLERAA